MHGDQLRERKRNPFPTRNCASFVRKSCQNSLTSLLLAVVLSLSFGTAAHATADGPDAWQVRGVAPNDRLNMRMGPGTEYLVIGSLAHDARGLKATTCTPFLTLQIFETLTQQQRDALPQRWCLVRSPDGREGWVAGRFLMEDGGEPVAASQSAAPGVTGNGDLVSVRIGGEDANDPSAVEAVTVVADLMRAYLGFSNGGEAPLQLPLARNFFFADMIPNIDPGKLGADPIIGGQDFVLENIVVELDPDQPPLRGMYPVRASFTNFGNPRMVTFYLRVDTTIAPRMRILQFDADGKSYF